MNHASIADYINDPLVQREALDEAYKNSLADFRYFCVHVMQMNGTDPKMPDFSHSAYDEAFAAHEVWLRMDGLGMMPRGTGKTTLWTELRCLWKGLKNPNSRIALASAKFENACKMLGVIRRWMVYHQGLREVFGPKGCLPAQGDKNWGTVHELDFPRRTANFMEKTLSAVGADQQITSTHYDEICCKPGSLVRTTKGLVPIEGIEKKTMVLSHDGKRHYVRRTFKSKFKGNLVGIWPYKASEPIFVTPNHPVLVRRLAADGLPSVKFVRADEVTTEDYLPFPRVEHDAPHLVKRKDDGFNGLLKKDSFFRFMGYWYAEGSVAPSGNTVRLTFGDSEEERGFVEDCKSAIRDSIGNVHIYEEVGPSVVRIAFADRRLAKMFRKWGRLAHQKFLPYWIKQAQFTKTREFLRAYWNGDGSRSERTSNETQYIFTSASQSLLADIQQMLLDYGVSVGMHKNRDAGPMEIVGRKSATNGLWQIVGDRALAEFLGFHDPKRPASSFKPTSYFFDDRFAYHRVRKVEAEKYDGFVYNMTVDGSETYCHELMVSHNCADDLINKENYGSVEQMRSVEEWWKLTRVLLVSGGRRLLIGTRWHFHDLYGNEIRREEERVAAGKNPRMHVCRVPARDGKGKPRFKHKGEDQLSEDLEDLGPTLYAGQIDLDPVPEGTQMLKESDLRKAFYIASDVLEKDPITKKLRVKDEFEVAITCDLAASTEEDADRSAIVVTATDPDGDIFILDFSAGRYFPSKCLDIVAAFRDRYGAKYCLAEKGVLRAIYKSDILEWNRDHPHERPLVFLDVDKGGGKGTLNDPILAMEPFVVAGKIHLLASQVEVLRELSMYPRWKLDDIADAICQRVRTPRRPRRNKRDRAFRSPTAQERCHQKVMTANKEYGW